MTMKLYSQHEVSRITGILPNTIQGWAKDGLIGISFSPQISRGIPRTYIASDIVQLAIVKKLSNLGFRRRLLTQLAHFFEETAPGKLHMSFKKRYLNPDRINEKVVFMLEFRDDEWHITPHEKTSQSIPSILNTLGDSTMFLVININSVVDKLRERL
jgi:hypothetical protein